MKSTHPDWTEAQAHPFVKICGIRTPAAAVACARAGASFLGFNFAPMSRRLTTIAEARRAVDALMADETTPHMTLRPLTVGIFVDQTPDDMATIAREAGLEALQLSGTPSPQACRDAFAATGLPIIAVMRFPSPVGPPTWPIDAALAPEGPTTSQTTCGEAVDDALHTTLGVWALLIDAPGTWGGSGDAWDYAKVASMGTDIPRLFLAGGLQASNVGAAIASVRPWAVDVASGVETDGKTDPDKVREFIDATRVMQ